MRTKDCHFDCRNVHELWELVKDPEAFWGDLGRQSRHLLKRLLEESMLKWRQGHLEADWHEQAPDRRRDHANGFYVRQSWPTAVGPLEQVRVPRCRHAGLTALMQAKVGDGLAQVSDQVIEMFLAGVSTRRVGELLGRITGLSISAGSVSNLAKQLDDRVRAFHSRPLNDDYVYLFLDGLHLKARGRKVSPVRKPSSRRKFFPRKRIVLVAYAVTTAGVKELIGFRLADSESAAACTSFLWNLYHRGLRGSALKLIVSDRSGGLTAAADEVYPAAGKQGCWFHKLGNVVKKLRRADQPACVAGLRKIYTAANRRNAQLAYQAWARRWRERYPDAVRCVEKDLDRLLAFYAMPRAHWRMVRTTNAIERCFREVRRRTDPIGTFLDDASISRLIYALCDYMNRKRAGQICREFKQTRKDAA